jgi:AraC-like DNA-binding protein
MKPTLEQIDVEKSQLSFKYFRLVSKAFKPYWHYHPELELTLIYQGRGIRFIGDSILPFGELDLVLVGKNLPHHWVSQATENDQIAYVIQFSDELFKMFRECDCLQVLFKRAKRGILFKNPNDQLIKDIHTFENLSELERISALIKVLGTLEAHQDYSLLTSEQYHVRQEKTSGQFKFLQINNYILENLDNKLTVNKVAEVAHMVPQSFCRWFKKHAGYSFITFVNIARIENACQLLLTKNLSIQTIAFSSGFESISHFNRTFRKIKGLSPSDYLKSNLKSH